MNILISGAGVAGLTVAYWLQQYGFVPTIVERAESLVIGGYKIDVRGSALEVLHRMGIHDAVVAASTRMQGALLVDRVGNVINRMSGDAAYCASPMSGQGSSLALIGAYVLAGELAAASGDHEAAFAAYDDVMRPFVNTNQELGIESARFMTSKSAETPEELSGSMIESVIDSATDRITEAANAIAFKGLLSLLQLTEPMPA
jgi:2-polyprenyl-6-methoxyphenol hydroxylase-like FAD-dependent oxidoreductase